MQLLEVKTDKKRYLTLLLLADEQENMIDRYLSRGTMYLLCDDTLSYGAAAINQPIGVCVVTDEGHGILEIKNLAIAPAMQRKGYGKACIEKLADMYRGSFSVLQVGTGESPLTLPFYLSCGFTPSHRLQNFFTEHYDHPIIEAGVRLTDMIYLQKKI